MGADALVAAPLKVENTGLRGPVVLLTDEDAAAIVERVPYIQHISREVDGNVTIVMGSASWTPEYWGVDASYANVFRVKISEGRFFDDEVGSGAKVIVLGARVAKKLFGSDSPVDQIVRMGGVPMRVIGVRLPLGSVGGQDQDNHVMLQSQRRARAYRRKSKPRRISSA
ncbi:MAG: ABC transporter permease [Beijerinckiaceae bacterium]